MLLRILRFVGVGVASMALANSAWAANVTTDASSMRVGGEFRADLTQSDNGYLKTDDVTPPSTSGFAVHEANLTIDGKINAKTEYRFEVHLAPGSNGSSPPGVLTEGYGKHWFANMFGMSIGRQRVAQGGWDQVNNDYHRTAIGQLIDPSTGLLPFFTYEDMLALHVMAGGELTVQFVNDATTADIGRYNKDAHPTFILNWKGDFNGIMPLVTVGTFDNQKSNYFDIGVSANMSGLMATLDFHQQTRTRPEGDEEKADVTTGFSLWFGYDIKGTAMPWLYYSSFDVAQDVDDDPKANAVIDPATGVVWNDNGTTLGLGANLKMFGDNWEPYVALVQQSGKFFDNAGEEETKSETMIKLGASGKI